jgi:catechol 2,3-dioxygenase-like lactoylglutathione lyase family enzyme
LRIWQFGRAQEKFALQREGSMILRHVALTCSSEKKSDRFYKDLLGLEKTEPKILPRTLSKAIFNFDSELLMINYRGKDVHFEIFITEDSKRTVEQIVHVCLEVEDLNAFLNECHHLEIELIQVPKGDRTLTFIRDDDGNLFEIK